MLPLGTDVETRSFPRGVFAISAVTVAAQIVMTSLALHGIDPGSVYAILGSRADRPFPLFWITGMLLHGGFEHLTGNLVFLWIFGPPLEDRIGTKRFLWFFLLFGCAGALLSTITHWVFTPDLVSVPSVGASGAISGVLGAFLFRFWRSKAILALGILPPFRFRAAYLLLYWFGRDLFLLVVTAANGFLAEVDLADHVGGFLLGAIVASRLDFAGDEVKENALTTAREKVRTGHAGAGSAALAAAAVSPDDPEAQLLLARTIAARISPGDRQRIDALSRLDSDLGRAAKAYLRAAEAFLARNDPAGAMRAVAERWGWVRDAGIPGDLFSALARAVEAEGRDESAALLLEASIRREIAPDKAREAALRAADLHRRAGRLAAAAAMLAFASRGPGGRRSNPVEVARSRRAVADGWRARRKERDADLATAARAAASAYAELPAVAVLFVEIETVQGKAIARIHPLFEDSGAAGPGSVLHARAAALHAVAAARVGAASHRLEPHVVAVDALPPARQFALLRGDTAIRRRLTTTAGRAIAGADLALFRWRLDGLFAAEALEHRAEERKATDEVARKVVVSSFVDIDRRTLFLVAMPWVVLAEWLIAESLSSLARGSAALYDLALGGMLVVDVALFRIVAGAQRLPFGISRGGSDSSERLAVDGMSAARSLEMRGDYAGAAARYRELLQRQPGRLDVRSALAELYRFRSNDPQRAATEYLAIGRGEKRPENAAIALLEASTLLWQTGNRAAAEKTLGDALARYPKVPSAEGARRLLERIRTGA